MTVIDKLACSLNRKDELPNQELAEQLAKDTDKKAIKELVDHLSHKSKDIQNDCIKVLYEIGKLKPELIADYTQEFLALLTHKNNRLQWGAMMALYAITALNHQAIFASLPKIIEAADNGSVITKDYAINILIELCSRETYADKAFALLNEQLLSCPTNQLPMYAENALVIVNDKNRSRFIKTLTSRLDDIEKDSKRKRVEKVLRKVSS